MPKESRSSLINKIEYFIDITITLINLTLLQKTLEVYTIIDYDAYLLSNSTILNNKVAVYLVNSFFIL